MNKIIKFFLFAILLGCWSCSGGEDTPTTEYAFIEVATYKQEIEKKGGKITVTFNTNAEWKASVNTEATWLSVFPTNGGAGSNTLTITAQPNDQNGERSGKVTITAGETSRSIPITQITINRTSIQQQIKALEKFYEATNGDEWKNNTNWLSNKPLKEWNGIHTDDNGNVITIHLYANNLKGTIPEVIGDLSSLETFDVSDNKLEGELPESFYQLGKLNLVSINRNKLSGDFSQFTKLTNLEVLYLIDNQFTGPIPENISDLPQLEVMYLSGNPITGSIPESIGKLTNMDLLFMDGCQLEGNIPESIGNLTKLEALDLSSNRLTGSIPSSIGNLKNLGTLDLSYNQLSGAIPDEFVKLTSLDDVSLYNNPKITALPSNNSIRELSCWQYQWWKMIHDTGIELSLEKDWLPAPLFTVAGLDGNNIVAQSEYEKNDYTILVQWNPNDSNTKRFIPTLVSLFDKYQSKKLGIIGWCNNWNISADDVKEYIKQEKMTWRNFKCEYNNYINKSDGYPDGTYSLTVHVVNSEKRVIFSSLLSDVNTLPDFLKERFGE